MPKVSVIVPIFKCEQYIERCVHCLMKQTLTDIEYIFINDSTPDNSMYLLYNVIKEYPHRQKQIKILEHQKNMGVTQSRKDGIEISTGDYIGWCDSDDYVEFDMFQKMYNVGEGIIDIVVCDHKEILSSNHYTTIKHDKNYNKPIEAATNMYGRPSWVLWNQIIKKEIIKKCINNITPVNYSEDSYLIWHAYFYAKSIKYIDEPLYNYNISNIHSLVHNIDMSWESWKKQEENINRIATLYYSHGKKYHVAINNLKFSRKYLFKPAFKDSRTFFNTFRESSWDILFFTDMSFVNRIKTFLVNNIYFLFKLTEKK